MSTSVRVLTVASVNHTRGQLKLLGSVFERSRHGGAAGVHTAHAGAAPEDDRHPRGKRLPWPFHAVGLTLARTRVSALAMSACADPHEPICEPVCECARNVRMRSSRTKLLASSC